jgi:hypothetical protein
MEAWRCRRRSKEGNNGYAVERELIAGIAVSGDPISNPSTAKAHLRRGQLFERTSTMAIQL